MSKNSFMVFHLYLHICVVIFVANPLVLDDDVKTALEVARDEGYSNVVRAIEVYACNTYFILTAIRRVMSFL